jgi:hypothetical protein
VGTILATNLINESLDLDWKGIFWGLLAAASYTLTMFTSNTLATHLPVFRKSIIMLLGGSVVVFAFLFFAQIAAIAFRRFKIFYLNFTNNTEHIHSFNYSILWKYGLILSLFGTIIPPILFNVGFPNAGFGLGSIVSSFRITGFCNDGFVLLGKKLFLFMGWNYIDSFCDCFNEFT